MTYIIQGEPVNGLLVEIVARCESCNLGYVAIFRKCAKCYKCGGAVRVVPAFQDKEHLLE